MQEGLSLLFQVLLELCKKDYPLLHTYSIFIFVCVFLFQYLWFYQFYFCGSSIFYVLNFILKFTDCDKCSLTYSFNVFVIPLAGVAMPKHVNFSSIYI